MSGDASGNLKIEFLVPSEENSLGYEYEFSFTDDNSFADADPEFFENG